MKARLSPQRQKWRVMGVRVCRRTGLRTLSPGIQGRCSFEVNQKGFGSLRRKHVGTWGNIKKCALEDCSRRKLYSGRIGV